ncbi:MAG: ABC transporter permease [Clostridiales bacterium]|jgi:simple sugar transport system permease protein|nr:ABC transporter permease [Clostridiales bacterium]
MGGSFGSKAVQFIKNNLVIVIFATLCIISVTFSGQPLSFVMREIVTRVSRNTVLILSLIPPVLCGLGLNFSIVIGAMAGEIGLLLVTHWHIDGIPGLLLAAVIGTFVGALFGILTGSLFNKTKGQEMIAGLILGYFSIGVFNFVFIYLVGSVIPFTDANMVLDTGVGLRNTINFNPDTQQALDKFLNLPFVTAIQIAFGVYLAAFAAYIAYQMGKFKKRLPEILKKNIMNIVFIVLLFVVMLLNFVNEDFRNIFFITQVPVLTFGSVALVCLFLVFLAKTKLGRDIKTVGQSMPVATSSGINVNKVRIIAVSLSIIIAAWGQVIFLQNMGNINTYGSHEQVGTFAIAALLVGGASVTKATIPQVFIGVILFHILYFTSPLAGQTLFGDPILGEYFRLFVSNIVIAISLALYTWRRIVMERKAMEDI